MQSLVELARQVRFDGEEMEVWDLFFRGKQTRKAYIGVLQLARMTSMTKKMMDNAHTTSLATYVIERAYVIVSILSNILHNTR